jgi:ribonuclease HI
LNFYTDGSCLSNPDGPGGWAVIGERDGDKIAELSGYSPSTTNNIMEMMAVLEAIRFAPDNEPFTVISDSEYVVKGITRWAPKWAQAGWRKKSGPIANLELWQLLYAAALTEPVTFKWVRGHDYNPFNELADDLAGKEARRFGARASVTISGLVPQR